MVRARTVGLTTALGQLVILDTAVQHGLGSRGRPGRDDRQTERNQRRATDDAAWLAAFLEVRRAHLANPVDEETTEVWRESIPRVDTLETLLTSSGSTWTPRSPGPSPAGGSTSRRKDGSAPAQHDQPLARDLRRPRVRRLATSAQQVLQPADAAQLLPPQPDAAGAVTTDRISTAYISCR